MRGRGYGRLILAALVLGIAAWLVWKHYGGGQRPGSDRIVPAPADAKAPPGIRIKVEVLNATSTRGLARRATIFLRERGFDVVASGTSREPRATTIVLDRSRHPEWAALVGRAMRSGVESRPDSSRYLDVTVILGADWRAPALPFHP